jgi:hypothetical protein
LFHVKKVFTETKPLNTYHEASTPRPIPKTVPSAKPMKPDPPLSQNFLSQGLQKNWGKIVFLFLSEKKNKKKKMFLATRKKLR